MKNCSKCSILKPRTEFYKDRSQPSGIASSCKECKKKDNRSRDFSPTYIGDKTCSKCRENKPKTEFYRSKHLNDGLQSICKQCSRESNSSRVVEPDYNGVKSCNDCGEVKDRREFSRNRTRRDGLGEQCRECRSIQRKSTFYYPDYDGEKECAQCQEVKQKIDFYRDSLSSDGLRRACIACDRVRNVEYYHSNKELYSAHRNNRRARVRSAKGSHSYGDIQSILSGQRYKCASCKVCIKSGYHVDHIVALANGGSNWPENLQILCPPCNLSKGAKCHIEWAQSLGRLL